jgi:chromosome partition protein MukE
MTRGFAMLQDVIMDPDFPATDLALRHGRHIDRDDAARYALLLDGQEHLEAFYRRYGCELIYKADGYFYLLPTSDALPRRHLGVGDMLVGQALALLYLDPASVERGGLVTKEQVIEQLVTVLGGDALIRLFLPKRRRIDERLAQKMVRAKVDEAIRRLAALGFAEAIELPAGAAPRAAGGARADDGRLRLRPALLRFAEPVRGLSAPAEALAKLVADGEIALVDDAPADGEGEGDEAGEGGGDGDGDGDDEPELET